MDITIDDRLRALHTYFTRASSMRELVKRMPEIMGARDLQGLPEELRPMLLVFETHNVLAVFYGLMFVVVEGVRDCKVKDAKLDVLFESPHFERFRRFRNAIFHFQPAFPVSEKQAEFMVEPESEKWAQAVWRELNRWFSDNITGPSLTEAGWPIPGEVKSTL